MLNRWNPLAEMSRLQSELNRHFDKTHAEPDFRTGSWMPPVDIEENAQEIVVRAELPGVKKEDVHLSVESGVLTVSGTRRFEHEERKNDFVRVERAYGNFVRSFTLPRTVDAERIKATLTDGVLTVTLPKRVESQARKISVA